MKCLKKIILGVAVLLLASCEESDLSVVDNSLPMQMAVAKVDLPQQSEVDLMFKVYKFRALKEGFEDVSQIPSKDFVLVPGEDRWLDYDEFKDYTVQLQSEDLAKYYYKLVVLATPNGKPEVEFSYQPSEEANPLDALRLRRVVDAPTGKNRPLSKHNYLGIGNISEYEVANGIIPVEFSNAAGALVFDFGKYSSPETSVALEEGFNSTLDRVYQIDIELRNYTQSLSWTCTNFEMGTQTEIYSYDLSSYLEGEDEGYKVKLGANGASPEIGTIHVGGFSELEIPEGTTRLYGPFLLMTPGAEEQKTDAGKRFELLMTFHYYDTYSNDDGQEAPVHQITLSLPQTGNYMNVVTGAYTLTRIKLHENRIIDVAKNGGAFTLDPEWNI